MKKTINILRFALMLGFVAIGLTAWSQNVANIEKMSVSTQMFLDELAGRITFDESPAPPTRLTIPGARQLPEPHRPIADPDTIDGNVYISAIVRVVDNSVIGELEALGAQIQCQFNNGLLTTNLPIDAIEQIAALEGVIKIDVSTVMKPLTNLARTATNVDDVLTLSNDASNAGLLQQYDGAGVILGIIDSGIDFRHIAFKDENGNSRIKGAYCYNGTQVTANWTDSGTLPTTDNSSSDHGTHTSSIAGGSSVIVNGTNVTVTSNHANATYGGMAPGADLFLAGTRLNTAHCLNAFQKMCNYADQQGKPLVVSNSWGSSWGPRDGNSDVSEVISNLFGDDHPNRICLFASSNDAGHANGGVGGGLYATGQSTQANPLGTILRTESYIESYGYQYYSGLLATAWTRATDANGIGINIYVINKSTGAIQYSYNLLSTNSSTGVNGNSLTLGGFNRSIGVYFDYIASNGKHQVMLYANNSITSGSSYAIAIEVYPIGGSNSTVDIWGGDNTYLTGNVSTNGHNWVYGSDDMSVDDEASMRDVISVGSYVTRQRSGSNNVGDISDFSSYAVEGNGPLGDMHPWITAPGEDLISAFNSNNTDRSSSYVIDVNNSSNPYGRMSGTSMATPAAAGIVALWFQAAQEVGKDLTMSEVKEIMKETAIRDSWVTTGSNRSHFGNGKIDALAGIKYILDNYGSSEPHISATPSSLTFSCNPEDNVTKQVTVKGYNLTGNITATLNDPDNTYSMTVSGANANGQTLTLNSGDIINVTYSPHALGTHTGSITLTSPGAESVIVTLDGRASLTTEKTLFDGTDENYFLPIFGYFYDEKQINQMIYPGDQLTEFQGKTLKSMTFYSPHLYFSEGKFNVKVGTTTQNTFPSTTESIVRLTPANITTVATNQEATGGGTTMTIIFDENHPFVYEGDNLLVDFEVTEVGNYDYSNGDNPTYFYGVNQTTYTGFNTHAPSSSATTNDDGIYTTGRYCGARQFLPKVTIVAEAPMILEPSLSADPSEVFIEDETDANRSAAVDVIAENLSGALTTTASYHWGAALNQDNTELTVTYQGKALHQVGSASVHSNADDLHASVAADYLYTGPIYIIGDVNNYYWNTNNGAQMNRDENGVYTVTVSTQQSSDAAYISFTKQLGTNIDGYRFGPVSGGNWWLTTETQGVYNPLDTVGNVNNIRVTPGYYIITIDSKNNRFMITPAAISSSVSPAEGTLDFGTVFTGSTSTQTITLTNDGDLPFTPSLSGLSGAFSTDYVPAELAPGESVTITITYAPQHSGSDVGTFTLSDGTNTYTWTLTGSAVTPVIHGYVDSDDQNVDFGEKALDETYTYSVRIYNDGDLPFDPVIDATGLDGVFAVSPTTGITIASGEYYDLTVSYHPTAEGSYSGTFTVTINGEPTTVTVTGSASASAISDDIIHSNSVTVPVYKTDLDVYGPYSYNQVETDTNRQLAANVTNGNVKVLAKDEDAITGYRLFHNAGSQNNSVNMTNWAAGNDQSSVAYAVHNIAQDNFTTYAKTGNSWAQDETYPVNGASELWINLQDNDEVVNVDTWYVPVVVADSKLGNSNTYGSRMEPNPALLSEIMVVAAYDDTKHHREPITDDATGMKYVYVTAQAEITASIPSIDVNGHTYECYKVRAWRQYKPYIIGQGEGEEIIELIGENSEVNGATGIVSCTIGSKDWTDVNVDSIYLPNEYTFIVKDGSQTSVKLIGRVYYKRSDVASMSMRGEGEEGGYFAMEDEENLPDQPTFIDEYLINKEVVDITYVNPLGVTSRQPFNGVNIIVIRYSDGTISTTKVMR